MSFLSDEERRRLERLIEKSINFAAEYPELNELLESYAEPMRTFINTASEIEEDWGSLRSIPRERKDEIDGLIDRIDRTVVSMDAYKVKVLDVDLVQLKANVEEEYVEVIDEADKSIREILRLIRSNLNQTRAACLALKKKLGKKVVDVDYLDEEEKKKRKK